MNDLQTADAVWRLQAELSKLPQYEPETHHYFADGMYCRVVSTPGDCLVVGKVHRKEHFYMVVSGTVAVTTDDGVQEITGPRVLVSSPGTKRAVYSITPSVRLTVHRTNSRDLDEVERELVEDDPTSTFAVGNKVKPGVLKCDIAGKRLGN